MENYYPFIMLIAMMAVMYFAMIRPENKRKKEADAMRASLQVGDVITTIGGIVGTICVVIESGADRVRVEFVKAAIGSKGAPANDQQ